MSSRPSDISDVAEALPSGGRLELVTSPMFGVCGDAPPEIFPGAGWIADQVRLLAEHSDCPPVYSLFSGIVTMGMAIGRSYGVKFGLNWVFPNFFCLLIGDSGLRKSTAVRATVSHLPEDLRAPRPGSAEGMYKRLDEHPRSLFVVDEWGGFVRRMSRDYMGGVMEDLTEVYENPKKFSPAQTKAQTISIERPFASILAASTPDWLEDRMKEGEFKGGFYSRFMFIPAKRRFGYMPWPTPLDPKQHRKQTARLEPLIKASAAATTPKPIAFAPAAHQLMVGWMRSHELGQAPDSILAGWHKRAPILAVKLALVHEFAQSGRLRAPASVGVPAVQRAIATVKWLHGAARELTGSLAFTDAQRDFRRMLSVIERGEAKGVTGRHLSKALRWDVRRFERTKAGLIAQGEVVEKRGKRHDSRIYIATKLLASGGKRDQP